MTTKQRPDLMPEERTVKTTVRLPQSLAQRIAAVAEGSKVAEFVRQAAEAEVGHRERRRKLPQPASPQKLRSR